MKLILEGNIPVNRYYVQMLCMIYYPGMTFSQSEEGEQSITLVARVERAEDTVTATLTLTDEGKSCTASHSKNVDDSVSEDKAMKLAIGGAMYKIGSEMFDYRPSWGILTGVRPSKVATEFMSEGNSKTKVKRILTGDYMVTPKKAQLAIDVALAEKEIIGVPKKRDCSVYISVPFCPTRCAYCSFVSYTSKRLLSLIPEYTERLCRDIERTFALIDELKMNVKTVYIGGGTPTILTAEQLESVLSTVARCTDVSRLEEYTLEGGRPDTIDEEKVAVAVKYGVTRMSVNPQTLNDAILCGVGRCHSGEDFFRAYDIVRQGGIKYINTDLIAGLPDYSMNMLTDDIVKLIGMGVDELQVESLKVLPGTRMRSLALEKGLRFSPMPPYEILQTPAITPNELRKAMNLSRTVDLYYNSPVWQNTTRELTCSIPGFLIEFTEYLSDKMVLDSPISVERRGEILYEYCKANIPDKAADVSIAWIKAGCSLKKEPAGATVKIKHIGQYLNEGQYKINIEYGQMDPKHRYHLLTAGERKVLFAYDSENHQHEPVFMATLT